MAVQIKCFVCNGVTSDDRECRVCEGKGQIESLLQLRVEDLKNWAERLQQQQQELDAQHQESMRWKIVWCNVRRKFKTRKRN